jgi:hypothetical protein
VIRTNRTIRTLRSTSILPAAILVGICADLLFYGKSLGISLLLFVLLFVGTLAFVARRSGVQAVRPNLWLLAPLFFFAGMVAVRDNAFVTALNVLAVATLSAYLLHYYAAGRVGEMGLTTAVILPAYTAARSLLTAVPIVTEAIDAPQVLRGSRSNLMPIVRGGLLAMPLLFVFTLLLASADLIFANQIVNLFSAINISRIFSLFFQGLFILAISWAMTGGLALALDGKDNAAALDHRFTRLRRFRFLGFTESTTLLSLVNLLFLSFVIVQRLQLRRICPARFLRVARRSCPVPGRCSWARGSDTARIETADQVIQFSVQLHDRHGRHNVGLGLPAHATL